MMPPKEAQGSLQKKSNKILMCNGTNSSDNAPKQPHMLMACLNKPGFTILLEQA